MAFAFTAIGLAVVFAALLGELAARVFVEDTAVFSRLDRWESHPRLGRVLKADQAYEARGAEYVINAMRLRDRLYEAAPPDGAFRIAVVGDSFVFGVGKSSEIFPEVLERRLGERFAGRVEVMSIGMPGYGTAQQNDFLEEYVAGFEFDLVLLSFCVGNDIRENKRSNKWDRKPESRARALKERSKWDALLANSRLIGAFRSSRRAHRKASARKFYGFVHDNMELARPSTYETDAWAAAWDRSVSEIVRMREFATARGAAFEVFLLPDEYQVDEALRAETLRRHTEDEGDLEPDLVQRRLSAALGEMGVPIIDPLPRFQDAHSPGKFYIPFDTHFDAQGNELAALVIEEAVLERHGASIEARTRDD